ncbi:hypothetical protein GIB67_028107, partial [Kingdonia uniflora]
GILTTRISPVSDRKYCLIPSHTPEWVTKYNSIHPGPTFYFNPIEESPNLSRVSR